LSTSRIVSWLATLVLLGCRDLVGGSDFDVEPADSPPAPLETRSEECRRCAAEQCEIELAACSDSVDCAALADCASNGPGPARRARCTLEHPDSSLQLFQLNRCVGSRCSEPCASEERWSCVSDPTPLPEPIADRATIRIQYWDILANQIPLSGLDMRACESRGFSDPYCTEGELARARTDESGVATFEVPLAGREPLDAFLDVSGEGYYPELRYHSTPIVHDVSVAQAGITQVAYALVGRQLEAEELPGHGFLTITALDCTLGPAPGVTIELSPKASETRRFYSRGKLNLDEGLEVTQDDGIALFTNVPAGLVRVRASVGDRVMNELEIPIRDRSRTALFLEPAVAK
jgi:hypothetical protein